ncbi:hypothetical protein [Nocardia iowensis]|uniref:Uncharacterized protein n=1 Tax=Nocardia iowensis TaxID=204891 RepID=A0ABX8RT62_NOCIO|nr:hypothetical protein [Nocardia iowensis]QXN92823.1 hypothetical protein KV110_06780 [Nocardia iowensis]
MLAKSVDALASAERAPDERGPLGVCGLKNISPMMAAPPIRKLRMIAEVVTALPSGAVLEASKNPVVSGAAVVVVSGRAHQPPTTARISRPKTAEAIRVLITSPLSVTGTPLCIGLQLYERSCSHS